MISIDPNILVALNDPTSQLQWVVGVNWDSNKDLYSSSFLCRSRHSTKTADVHHIIVWPLRHSSPNDNSHSKNLTRDVVSRCSMRPSFRHQQTSGSQILARWNWKFWNYYAATELLQPERAFFNSVSHILGGSKMFSRSSLLLFRIAKNNGLNTLKLVIGNAWVAPIKCITNLNLELQAAV